VVPVRAICQAQSDLGRTWEVAASLFATPLGDSLHWNIVIGSDESVLDRVYTQNLVNVVIVSHVHPRSLRALRRWHVWTMREWSLIDYYLNARWVPPVRHTIANALLALGQGFGEGEEELVQPPVDAHSMRLGSLGQPG
jgi:hypothetical protein